MKAFIDFLNDENGAITVDFVVLTAAICTLGFVVVGSFSEGTTNLANETKTYMDNIDID